MYLRWCVQTLRLSGYFLTSKFWTACLARGSYASHEKYGFFWFLSVCIPHIYYTQLHWMLCPIPSNCKVNVCWRDLLPSATYPHSDNKSLTPISLPDSKSGVSWTIWSQVWPEPFRVSRLVLRRCWIVSPGNKEKNNQCVSWNFTEMLASWMFQCASLEI